MMVTCREFEAESLCLEVEKNVTDGVDKIDSFIRKRIMGYLVRIDDGKVRKKFGED